MNERRGSPRHSLVLSAEMTDESSGAKAAARATDVNRSGCYLDTLNPFPVGTQFRIKLVHQGEVFESRARIVYQVPGMGMGVSFENSDLAQQAVLDRWLAGAPPSVP